VVVDALSMKSLHMSALMVKELVLIEQFRDSSLVCELSPENVKLEMLNVTARFFANFIFNCFNMCLCVLVCDYLSLGVISWVFVLDGYFGLLVSKGNLVIS